MKFKVGDRVRWIDSKITGTIDKVYSTYPEAHWVRFDHKDVSYRQAISRIVLAELLEYLCPLVAGDPNAWEGLDDES